MVACNGVSQSGLFEVYGEVLVEGDCVTRSRVHRFRMATLATSEAAKAYIDKHFPHVYIAAVFGPDNYVARYAKLMASKAKHATPVPVVAASDSDAPF